MSNPENEYIIRKKFYEINIRDLNKWVSIIGNLRLATFLIGFSVVIYTYILKNLITCGAVLILALGIFTYLVIKHNQVIEERKYAMALKDINDKSMHRLNGKWNVFEDDGNDFTDENHPYSGDLDIFGKNSLFQWINSSKTYMGRQSLKHKLANPLKSPKEIKNIQEAVKELSVELDWRQEFEAEGIAITHNSTNPDELYKWAEDRQEVYSKKVIIYLMTFLPVLTMILIILPFITTNVSSKWRLLAISVQILLLIPDNDKRSYALSTIYKYKDSIKIYKKMLVIFENKDFKSAYLQELRNRLLDGKKCYASKAINNLFKVSDRISDRKNLFYIVFNILFLWDYQCMFQLERWKTNSGVSIKNWFETLGELEALSGLAIIAFDHEDWAIPKVSEDGTVIKANALGHPLLGTMGVRNEVAIQKPNTILLVTGSNMSGKSTFLRTVGINLILCYIGAPVCAISFVCPIMDLYTCMRVSDNLEKNISSFYAEILRIKIIVNAVKEKNKVFFLLDEIFKGTNSSDRHVGAKILIKQLGEQGACGLVSTHDLELGELEKEYNKVKNYHFQEYYEAGELKFDYKLRLGVSTSRNAQYLIKLAGIEI